MQFYRRFHLIKLNFFLEISRQVLLIEFDNAPTCSKLDQIEYENSFSSLPLFLSSLSVI